MWKHQTHAFWPQKKPKYCEGTLNTISFERSKINERVSMDVCAECYEISTRNLNWRDLWTVISRSAWKRNDDGITDDDEDVHDDDEDEFFCVHMLIRWYSKVRYPPARDQFLVKFPSLLHYELFMSALSHISSFWVRNSISDCAIKK